MDACYKIILLLKGLHTIYVSNYWRLKHNDFDVVWKLLRMQFVSHISFEDFLCASALCACAILSYIITSKYMFVQFFSIFVSYFLWRDYVRGLVPFLFYIHTLLRIIYKYSSKFTENSKGIVLKAPLLLNVNCAKILAKNLIL